MTLLGNGSVGQRPAVWRAPGPDGPWTRTDLPGDGSLGEAHAATCDEAGRCTVVGEVDGTLRGWTLAADDTVTALPLPTLAVGEHDLLTAPLLRGGESTVLLASGGVAARAHGERRRQRRRWRSGRRRRHPAADRSTGTGRAVGGPHGHRGLRRARGPGRRCPPGPPRRPLTASSGSGRQGSHVPHSSGDVAGDGAGYRSVLVAIAAATAR